MSNNNVRRALELLYGTRCFITGEIKQRTYHHVIKKCLGGEATIENGIVLNRDFHRWLHSLENTNPSQYELINDCIELAKKVMELDNQKLICEWEEVRKRLVYESKDKRL